MSTEAEQELKEIRSEFPQGFEEIVCLIADRAGELADQSMFELRMVVGTEDTVYGREQETLGMSKGRLIEEILVEEYSELGVA